MDSLNPLIGSTTKLYAFGCRAYLFFKVIHKDTHVKSYTGLGVYQHCPRVCCPLPFVQWNYYNYYEEIDMNIINYLEVSDSTTVFELLSILEDWDTVQTFMDYYY